MHVKIFLAFLSLSHALAEQWRVEYAVVNLARVVAKVSREVPPVWVAHIQSCVMVVLGT